jgi:uncharacterized protein YkvS
MIKITNIGNYLKIEGTKTIIRAKSRIEFQKQPDGKYDVVVDNSVIFDAIPFDDFRDETNTAFIDVATFENFIYSNSGAIGGGVNTISGGGLTDSELRATPLQVTVTNPTDLTVVENKLNDVLTALQNIDTNTDGIEGLIQDTIDEITANGTLNNSNLQSVISELQGLDVNTDEIETLIDDVLNATGLVQTQVAETNTRIGTLTETAPATDTTSSGLNGRLQRIAQRLTSLITALGSPFQAGGSIGNTAFGVNNGTGASAVNIQDGGNSITVDGTVAVTGVSTSAKQDLLLAELQLKADLTETQPVSITGVIDTKRTPTVSNALSPSIFSNRGANATLNVKATAGNLFSLSCYNDNNADRWLQLHNTATVPTAGNIPVQSFLVPSKSQTIMGTDYFTENGINFSVGIAFGFSTTRDTYTAGTNTDQTTQINFI